MQGCLVVLPYTRSSFRQRRRARKNRDTLPRARRYTMVAIDIGVGTRWGGCRPPQTASQCARVVIFRGHTAERTANEEYDDRG